jgi:predicted RNA binding protein YcfA (HicA-like mRNA interferase family)
MMLPLATRTLRLPGAENGGNDPLHCRPDAHIFAHARPRNKPIKDRGQLERDGWQGHAGGKHDVFKHPVRPGRIMVPRHRMLSPGVARAIAKVARWRN